MDSTENSWGQPISARDGGYFLASFHLAPPPDEDWEPTVFPEKPGEVLADGPVASINIMNGDEERVLLSCIAVNQAPSDREIQRRTDPVEQHPLRMWPADRGLRQRTHWWTY